MSLKSPVGRYGIILGMTIRVRRFSRFGGSDIHIRIAYGCGCLSMTRLIQFNTVAVNLVSLLASSGTTRLITTGTAWLNIASRATRLQIASGTTIAIVERASGAAILARSARTMAIVGYSTTGAISRTSIR